MIAQLKTTLTFFLILLIIGGCNTGEKPGSFSELDKERKLETGKKDWLIAIVQTYVKAIKEKEFSMIPYAENATLRSPFTQKGVSVQLKGKESLFKDWWKPLVLTPDAKEVVFEVTDYYFNSALTSIIAEMVVTDHNFEPPVKLWVAERFTLNEKGELIDQINHFDVRDALTPGWQND
jgi:hypothetical protein